MLKRSKRKASGTAISETWPQKPGHSLFGTDLSRKAEFITPSEEGLELSHCLPGARVFGFCE